MLVYDADAHIEESPETFSDKYLDPAFRSNRPQVIAYGGRPHWAVDYQVLPRFRRAQALGAVAILVPGTAGDKLLGPPSLLPFFEEAASQDLPIGVHVLWSSPALNGLVDDLYYSTLIPFVFPVLLGFISIVGSGL